MTKKGLVFLTAMAVTLSCISSTRVIIQEGGFRYHHRKKITYPYYIKNDADCMKCHYGQKYFILPSTIYDSHNRTQYPPIRHVIQTDQKKKDQSKSIPSVQEKTKKVLKSEEKKKEVKEKEQKEVRKDQKSSKR